MPVWLFISKDNQSLLQTRRTLAVLHCQCHGMAGTETPPCRTMERTPERQSLQKGLQGKEEMQRTPGSLTKHRNTGEQKASPGLVHLCQGMHSTTSSMTPLWRCHSRDMISL